MGMKGQAEHQRLHNAVDVILEIVRNGKYNKGGFKETQADGWIIHVYKGKPLV